MTDKDTRMRTARPRRHHRTVDLALALGFGEVVPSARAPHRRGRRPPAVAGRPPAAALAVVLAPVAPRWQERARCQEADIGVFYPPRMTDQTAEPAKRLCQGCPVRESCLRFALATGDRYGIFGGTTPKERRVLHYTIAVATRSLAERVGVQAAARQRGTSPQRLERAWDLWGLGRPARTATKAAG